MVAIDRLLENKEVEELFSAQKGEISAPQGVAQLLGVKTFHYAQTMDTCDTERLGCQ
jgi:hypothetical protein